MNVIKWVLTNWKKITIKQLKFISLVAHNLQSGSFSVQHQKGFEIKQ